MRLLLVISAFSLIAKIAILDLVTTIEIARFLRLVL